MPLSNQEILGLLTRRQGSGGGQPRSLREILDEERRVRQQIGAAENQAVPRPPLQAAGDPLGGVGGYGDLGASISALGARVPEQAAQGPVSVFTGPDTSALQTRADKLRMQARGAFAGEMAGHAAGLARFAFAGPRVTGDVYNWSTRTAKRDVRPSDETTLRSLMKTPAVTYNYKADPPDTPRRTGVIAEEAPDRMTDPDHTMVSIPRWIEMLQGSVRALAADVKRLQGKG